MAATPAAPPTPARAATLPSTAQLYYSHITSAPITGTLRDVTSSRILRRQFQRGVRAGQAAEAPERTIAVLDVDGRPRYLQLDGEADAQALARIERGTTVTLQSIGTQAAPRLAILVDGVRVDGPARPERGAAMGAGMGAGMDADAAPDTPAGVAAALAALPTLTRVYAAAWREARQLEADLLRAAQAGAHDPAGDPADGFDPARCASDLFHAALRARPRPSPTPPPAPGSAGRPGGQP